MSIEKQSKMTAFLPLPTPCAWTSPASAPLLTKPFVSRNFQSFQKRRRSLWTCVTYSTAAEDESPHDVLYGDMVSDDDYVVLDGKDVGTLLEQLESKGLDSFDLVDEDQDFAEQFLRLAEKISDEKDKEKRNIDRRSSVGNQSAPDLTALDVEVHTETRHDSPSHVDASGSIHQDSVESRQIDSDHPEAYDGTGNMFQQMEYFKDDHMQFMPSWAKKAYLDGEHDMLEEGSRRIAQNSGNRRLHSIVEQRKRAGPRGIPEQDGEGEGIYDCTVMDVADDYHVPVEFVVDAMLDFGVPLPIEPTSSVRNKMTSEEIERLLKLITSFDAIDLADRYSDKSIKELTDDYDLDENCLVDICAKERLYLCVGVHTRLSIPREDRVLEIALKDGLYGQPYPDLLDGLQ